MLCALFEEYITRHSISWCLSQDAETDETVSHQEKQEEEG